ncbi:exodeoxyribonuclease III [Nesterenkonia sp. AN1]|uniref:Exodeoxyribonuclease-3 n=1 Tax=Nesterenkonia aurantiaca TaxID=1436010 RepID=A0A4R7G542_9MICC|nr:exodeoxyribonuclease III [Nesterenkonia sp. AN1]TDS86413.1 exodeoxyribonuclease-3 [Nesterenkonia aurantiaca]
MTETSTGTATTTGAATSHGAVSSAEAPDFGEHPHRIIDPKPAGKTRIASVNVNGIRAAHRKGMGEWLAEREIDILALQEVRANEEILTKLVTDMTEPMGEAWHVHEYEAADKGRAGVAIISRSAPIATRNGIGEGHPEDEGRWIEADYALGDGSTLTVVSVYVHSGEVGTAKQEHKMRFLQYMSEYLPTLAGRTDHLLVMGDLNVGHRELDIKNWKGNVKNSGFLPEERAYFDQYFQDLGYVDVARSLAGEVEGPYTWWSYRGKAFDNDTGWRIDYHMATAGLAELAGNLRVDRAQDYSLRWSDHAPLVVDYQLP